MPHLPDLIQDLALILVVAAFIALLCKKIKQPVILGYIIAGLLVSPNVPILPTVIDIKSIQIWADIGVLFLMFGLGLEFSFKKLFRVGNSAIITAFIKITITLLVGFLCGQLLNWSYMDSVFLGGILAISSTTISIRVFEELELKNKKFVHLVFGILIIEDLVAILLLVLLSSLALTQQFEGVQMLYSVFKLLFFMVLWFSSGIFIIPSLFKKIKIFLNDESLLIFSLGLCFFMVVLATGSGFSSALGAFVMGSILAETMEVKRIEKLISPIKDLFAAIFFVSVGMLIDPFMLWKYIVPICIVSFVAVFGKALSAIIGAMLSGQKLKSSVQTGLSLTHIGEFSFIIAGLGLSLNVTSGFLYPVAVGVSILTIFITPYLIRFSEPLYLKIDNVMPLKWRDFLTKYQASTQSLPINSDWSVLIKTYIINIMINTVIIISIFWFVSKFFTVFFFSYLENIQLVNLICFILAIFISAPFSWALVLRNPNKIIFKKLWVSNQYRIPLLVLESFRFVIGFFLLSFLSSLFISLKITVIVVFLLSLAFLVIFSRHIGFIYNWFESRFMQNYMESERKQQQKDKLIISDKNLVPWDAHITTFFINPNSTVVGKSLEEIKLREKTGITIVMIERGEKNILAPTKNEFLFPHDKVSILGEEVQIENFKDLIGINEKFSDMKIDSSQYGLIKILVQKEHFFCFKSIKDSEIREKTLGLIVGIEKGSERIINPDASIIIQPGDLIWIVGNYNLINDKIKQKI